MAMIAELFAGFESLKNVVDKLSESFEKGADMKSLVVRAFEFV